MSDVPSFKPLEEFGGDKVVAFAVGVVDLGHQVGQGIAGLQAGFEGGDTIDQREAVVGGEATDLIGVLVERIGRIVELGGLVGRRRQQDQLGLPGAPDHALPRCGGAVEAEAAVIERVIDGDEVGLVAEDVAFEASFAEFGGFAADRGDDDVNDGVGRRSFRVGWSLDAPLVFHSA